MAGTCLTTETYSHGVAGGLRLLTASNFAEAEVYYADCYCRVCQADLELVGRLKGTETHAMQSLAQNILFRMLSMFAEVAAVGYEQLLSQLRIAWLTPKFLPRPIRDLFVGRSRLTSLECGVLEAFVRSLDGESASFQGKASARKMVNEKPSLMKNQRGLGV
ncbi:MAG: hypothetical protein SFV81_05790 [Pirellulaceae bacterium]|nr:hypothetical protein [Pirellulaceae bacterium]